MMKQPKTKKPPPFFPKKTRLLIWQLNHLKILKALNDGCKTIHEIYLATKLSYYTIMNHKKEIIKCPKCEQFINKNVSCFFCFSKLDVDM